MIRVSKILERSNDLIADSFVICRRNCTTWVTTRKVDIDLSSATCPTSLGLIGAGSSAAIAWLLGSLQASIGEDFGSVHREPLGRKAMIRAGKGGGITTHERPRQRQFGIRIMIRTANIFFTNSNTIVFDAVSVVIVVIRVRVAINIRRRGECHELMRELIGYRVTHKRDVSIRLEVMQNIGEIRISRSFFEIATLLDVRLFINDARFEWSKIG